MARPPLLPDATILALIAELHAQQGQVTGTRVREELQRRHGHRAGVTRLYRLLHRATAPSPLLSPSAPTAPATATADLQAELDAALERARLAEHREEHHQARWANEIATLREQVRTLGDASHRLRIIESELQSRSRELAAAYKRIADLEASLR